MVSGELCSVLRNDPKLQRVGSDVTAVSLMIMNDE